MRLARYAILVFLSLPIQHVVAKEKELCGAYCLYLGLKSLDSPIESFSVLNSELGNPPKGGYRLAQLEQTARKLGFQTIAVSTSTANLQLRTGRFACIAHVTPDHFVLVTKIDAQGVHVIDHTQKRIVPFITWDHIWSRNALLLSKSPLVPEEDLHQPWNWRLILWSIGGGLTLIGAVLVIRQYQHRKRAVS